MTREKALTAALRRLNGEIDRDRSLNGRRNSVLFLSPDDSPERIAFLAEFVQCFDANEDLFLAYQPVYYACVAAYRYFLARTNTIPPTTLRESDCDCSFKDLLSYSIAYGLRQGPVGLLPNTEKKEP